MTNAIFGFIGSLEKEDIISAIEIFMSKYQLAENTNIESVLARLPFNKVQGLCYTIKLIMKHLGRLVDDKIPYLGKIIIGILKLSLKYYTIEKDTSINVNEHFAHDNNTGIYVKTAHTIYSEAIKRLKELYSKYNETNHLDEITKLFVELIMNKISKMKEELSQGKSNILNIFVIWSANSKNLQKYFVMYSTIFNSLVSLLTASKLVPEVASSVVEILHNLLFSDSAGILPCEDLLRANVDFIISSIYSYLEKQATAMTMKETKTFAVLGRLALYIQEGNTTIDKLIELLTPKLFLAAQMHGKKYNAFLNLIQVLKTLFRIYDGNDRVNYLHQYSSLLLKVKDCVLKKELAELLLELAKNDPIKTYAEIVLKMNSYIRNNMELEPDFDIVIKETNEFNSFLESRDCINVPINSMRIVIYQYLSCLTHEDYSLRSVICHGLKQFITGKYINSVNNSDTEIKSFIINDFLPATLHAMKVRDDVIFRSVIDVFRTYLITSASASKEYKDEPNMYLDLIVLTNSKDEEQDFFNNISHTQVHRRFRAIRNGTTAIEEKKISTGTTLKVLLPLADIFLFQERDEETKRKQTAIKKSEHVRQAAIDATEMVGAIVSQLTPIQYKIVINKYANKLKKLKMYKEGTQEIVVNVICKALDKFPFDLVNVDEVIEREVVGKDVMEILKKLSMEDSQEKQDQEIEDLLENLRKTVFPILKSFMIESKKSREEEGERHNNVNPHAALALLRVAKKLGVKKYLDEFEKVITILVGPLRSHDYELRDKVRNVFYQIIDSSSPFILHIVLNELSLGLTKGHQRHVLLYTVYGLFQRIVKKQKEQFYAKVDYCLPLVLPLLMKGITGELAEEAETEEVVRQCKEAKNPKAAEAYGLLAQIISLEVSLDDLMKPLVEQLETARDVKQINKCETALGKVTEGILKNTGLNECVLLSLCKRMIEKGFVLLEKKDDTEHQQRVPIYKTMYEHKAENFLIQEGAASGKRLSLSLPKNTKNEHLSGKAISFFGLSILFAGISRQLVKLPGLFKVNTKRSELTFDVEEKEEPMEIEPTWIEDFVPYLLRAFRIQHSQIIQIALRIYDKLLDQRAPLLQAKASEFLDCVIKQFDYINLSDQEMVQAVFRCVAHIIDTNHSTLSLSKNQVQALLTLIKTNMREAERQVSVFKCVRAIVNLKERVKGIDEIMDYVSELMVSNSNKNVRGICSGTFIDYVVKVLKLGSQKFSNKVNFLLRNLSYENNESRLHLLEVLEKIINYIMGKEQWEWIDTIFVTLVLRMANEESSKCRKKLVEVIENLIKKSPNDSQKQIVGSILTWLNEDKVVLKSICFQLIGIIVKVWRDAFVPYVEAIMVQILNILQNSVEQMKVESAKDEDEKVHEEIKGIMKAVKLMEPEEKIEDRNEWTLCYLTLVCLEKFFITIKGHLLNYLREHKNNLMNLVASLLEHKHYWIKHLSCRLIGHYFSDREKEQLKENICYFKEQSSKDLTTKLIVLFKSKYLEERLATQTIKNLLFILKNSDEEGIGHYILKKVANMGKSVISGPESERIKIKYLLTLLGVVTRGMLTEELEKEISLSLSLPYRVATDERYKGSEEAMQANDTMKMIEETIGVERYTEGLNKLKAEIQAMRRERKEKQKLIKLTNPEVAIKQKMKAKEKSKEKRKRKNKEWAIKRKGAVLAESSVIVRKFKSES